MSDDAGTGQRPGSKTSTTRPDTSCEQTQVAPAAGDEARRTFLANAGKVAAAAPAAALLLAASSIPNKAHAQTTSGGMHAGGGDAALAVFLGAAAAWHKMRGR